MVRCSTSALRTCGALAAGFFLLAAGPARSEILLEGDAASVRLEVKQAPIGEILAAFGERYGVRYRAAIPLDLSITGSYAGPLPRVIARVLEGYDYVARISPDAIDIAYIRTRGGALPASTSMMVKRVDLPISVGQLK